MTQRRGRRRMNSFNAHLLAGKTGLPLEIAAMFLQFNGFHLEAALRTFAMLSKIDGEPTAIAVLELLFTGKQMCPDKFDESITCEHDWHDYGTVTNSTGTRRIVACQTCGLERQEEFE